MVGSGPNQVEYMGAQRQDHFLHLERKRDWEGSVHTTHTSRSQSQGGSHISHEENARNLQQEIDHLRRRLRRKRRRRTPSSSESPSDDNGSYMPRSRTPSSESFSCDEDYHPERRNRSSSCKGMGNDVMSKALNQISRLPFTQN